MSKLLIVKKKKIAHCKSVASERSGTYLGLWTLFVVQ